MKQEVPLFFPSDAAVKSPMVYQYSIVSQEIAFIHICNDQQQVLNLGMLFQIVFFLCIGGHYKIVLLN